MPTDEQRMREHFEKWARIDRELDQYIHPEPEGAWRAFRSRDAEVQALKEALESVHYRATRWEVLPTVEAHQSVLRDIGEDARAALAGGEEGEPE